MPEKAVISEIQDVQVALGCIVELLSEGRNVDRSGLEVLLQLVEERLDRAASALLSTA